MASDHHQTLSAERVCNDFHKLHEAVARNWGRIEITSEKDGAAGGCVLISKAELAHIERALEIYGESHGGREMSASISNVVQSLHPHQPTAPMIDLPTDTFSSQGDSATV